ncbi:uncharacterized protein LOC119610756 [Lucilia sericata]|uniref:uncharacterized protein LOC119610756 n=1 Tax=Lucilia sericata TaxID=13632 RepID=UPI0018A83704|nr:uncharacterized protein LOC119610756 [Lucilia sericata]
MDLNLVNTTTAIVNTNQENNQLLLNAIKNKFAAQTAQEAAAFSPPKFNIPLLKIPSNASTENTNTNGSCSNTPPNSQLNQFLLKQLQEKHTNNVKDKESTGFVLPQLQFNNNSDKSGLKFELPLLTQATAVNTPKDNKISSLTSAINKLQVQDLPKTEGSQLTSSLPHNSNIDLTTALSSKKQSHQGTPPTRDFHKSSTKSNAEDLDFVIPFIDCDRLDNSRKHDLLLPLSNEYCITDISQLLLKHSLVEPSVIGRFLCLADDKYSPPAPLQCLSQEYRQQPVKHYIAPFRFETKSPDDMVMEALNKYQRRHYN